MTLSHIFRPDHKFRYCHLLVFPLAFLILQILIKCDCKWFFLSAHDPAYAFLLNGLNLALGNTELGLSGFPGTTLQCLIALNLFICNLFNGNASLAESVLSNPEYYLNIISYEIIALNTIALVVLGFSMYKKTGNLTLSIAIQLTPFVDLKAFSFNSIIMLEPILLCVEIFLLMIISEYAFGKSKKFSRRNIIVLGILMALGFATKIVFIPVLFLPFFALKGLKNKLLYALVILLAIIVLLIPIYPTFSSFLAWNTKLFTHTGIYGSGSYDLFDWKTYSGNLQQIFSNNAAFVVVFMLICTTALVALLTPLKRKIPVEKRRILYGVATVFAVNVLMVAKHYSFHYLFVSYHLVVFGFLLWLYILPFNKLLKYQLLQNKYFRITSVYLTGALMLFLLIRAIQFSPSLVNPRLKGLEFVQSHTRNAQRIVILEKSCPFIETALYHGLAYSNGMKPVYARILKTLYPSTYFYNVNQNILHDWINDYNLSDVLSRSNKTYVYYGSTKDTLPPSLRNQLETLLQKGYVHRVRMAYQDTVHNDYIYEINTDTQKLSGQIIRHETVYCDFESLTADSTAFSTSDSAYQMSLTQLRSADRSFSGKFSFKLNKENTYGPGMKIKVRKGYYRITAGRFSGDGHGMIVAAGNGIYKSNGIAETAKNGWETIVLTVDIPEKLAGEEFSIYFWYPATGTCYFDDFSITYFEVD